MKIVIPAAGYATRLGELTEDIPKHLLEIGGKPMINYLISGIEKLSINEVFLVTNAKFYNQFLAWRDSLDTSLNIEIINDNTVSNKDRLGTVGDIHFAIKEAGIDDDILIIAGDNLYFENGIGYNLRPFLHSFSKLEGMAGVIGLFDVKSLEIAKQMNQMTFALGEVPMANEEVQILSMVEKDPNPKSTLIAVMIEAYPRAVIKYLKEYLDENVKNPEARDKIGNFRSWLLAKKKFPIYGYHLPGQWFDIGLVETLKQAREFYKNK